MNVEQQIREAELKLKNCESKSKSHDDQERCLRQYKIDVLKIKEKTEQPRFDETDKILVHRAGVDYQADIGPLISTWTREGTTLHTANAFDDVRIDVDATINGVNIGMGRGDGPGSTALGTYALVSNTTGYNNTAIGYDTLTNNTEGKYNTAVGLDSLWSNTTGMTNTAVGRSALKYNTTGVNNTALGVNALLNCTEGIDNTALGNYAGKNCTTGKGNVIIGSMNSADTYAPAFSIKTESDRISMGSKAVTDAYIHVAWTVTSDARDKTSFASVPYGLDFVKQLQPTAYQFKAGTRGLRDPETDELIPVTAAAELPSGPVRYGFLAQDILALEGDNPVIIDNEDPENLKYRGEALVPVLVNAIKEQQVLIDALTARLDALEAK